MSPQLPAYFPLPFFFFFFFFFFFVSLPSQTTCQQTHHDERAFLLQLKQQWNVTFLNWNSNTNHCTDWKGVSCSTNNSITSLSFNNYNISSTIPPSFCRNLPNLIHLDFSYNYFRANFPTTLYDCTNLQYLDLSQNLFTGQIPSDVDRLSSHLLYLNLEANTFYGVIPPAIGRLPSLQQLLLVANKFNATVPPEIGDLQNLEVLQLAYNPFSPSRIPVEFGRLKKLRFLWISDSNLTGEIPETLGKLQSLQHLDLSTNKLIGRIPDGFFLLRNLSRMYLYDNKLSGEIPRRIETLQLKEIDISMNDLSGTIPEDFGKLQFLIGFDMYMNQLTGEIPAGIGRIPSLERVRLFKNGLNGSLPPDFGLYSNLKGFEVSDNKLSGSLPEHLCHRGTLNGLVVFSNSLTGEVPKSLATCNSLVTIQLYKNKLSGSIPAGIWSLNNLSSIIIRDNSFSGELANVFAWNLTRIDIRHNRFSGKIPPGIMSAKNLQVFEASNNLFSGEIPVEITALSRLLTLSLDGNRLSGQIPPQIISWKSLTTLNLSRNQLTGEIPSRLGLLSQLNGIDLSDNQVSGEIPPEIGDFKLTFLNLSSNRLNGRIPPSLESSAFDDSFLNNPGLCSINHHLLGLKPCISNQKKSSNLSSSILALILVVSSVIFVAAILLTLYALRDYWKKKKEQDLSTWKLTSFQRLHFTEENILSSITESNLIGSGGSGKVYRVIVNRSDDSVAVKKIWSRGKLEHKLEKEFEAEVQILGTIRHSNIVKLLCCISCANSKLLVYEFMENSSLDRWLHAKRRGSSTSRSVHHVVLDWPTRLQIAIGAAQGLCYMHHDCSPPVIHRDVKSSNILLDSQFTAKIADFGLAKILAKGSEPHTMSAVAGSFGYFAPEYAYTTKVNEKIDIYSFGVVLLELVTGKEANYGDEHSCLADWAWRQFQEEDSIVDALDDEIKEPSYIDQMSMVFKIGLICTGTLPSSRPSMKEVVQILQRCGTQQDKYKHGVIEYDRNQLLTTADNLGIKEDSDHRKGALDNDNYSLTCDV